MEIIVGKTAGFCAGIFNTIKKTNEILEEIEERPIYCLGDLAHNKQLMDKMKEKGLKVVDNLEKEYLNVIVRAHGITKEIYDKAEEYNISLFDLTCPKVLNIHKICEEYANKGYYIILIGEKNHPEVTGTHSFCGKNSKVIEKQEDIKSTIEDIINLNKKDLLILSQTTFSLKKFDELLEEIENEIKSRELYIDELEIKKTICNATKIRQEETEKLSKQVELMIIIGGKKSSNTNKLYEIARKNCKEAIFIQTKGDIDINVIKEKAKIGVMAGASTPEYIIKEVIDYIGRN